MSPIIIPSIMYITFVMVSLVPELVQLSVDEKSIYNLPASPQVAIPIKITLIKNSLINLVFLTLILMLIYIIATTWLRISNEHLGVGSWTCVIIQMMNVKKKHLKGKYE